MKKKIFSLCVILALLLSCSGLAETLITVSGSGTLHVPADTCTITLGVSVRDKSASDAQSRANEKLDAIREACVKTGISKDAIATGFIHVGISDDSYSYDSSWTDETQLYEAASSIIICTNDFSIAAKVIDACIAAGADTVTDVSFSLSDPSAYNDRVFSDACKDAYAKAEILAGSLELSISGVKSVDEGYTYAYEETTAVNKVGEAFDASNTVIDGANISVSTTINITYIAE